MILTNPISSNAGKKAVAHSVQLHDELTTYGYTGSGPLLRLFLADLRKKHRATGDISCLSLDISGTAIQVPSSVPPKARIARRLSATRASWLFISQATHLNDKQKRQVEHIRAGHSDFDLAYQICQEFIMILAERKGKDFEQWLTQAEKCLLPELKRFAKGLRRDYAAVKAACSLEISNGQVEGQVHRLKLQKRQVYGRANFDLLRLRVLSRT